MTNAGYFRIRNEGGLTPDLVTCHLLPTRCSQTRVWKKKSLLIDLLKKKKKKEEEPVQVCLFCVFFEVSSIPEGFTIDECATCLRRNGPFRIQPSQLAGQSAPCLFMLTCLLFSLLLLLFLAPHPYSSTCLLYVPSICLRRLP